MQLTAFTLIRPLLFVTVTNAAPGSVTQRLTDVTGPDTVRCFVAEVSVGGVRL